MTNLNTEQGGKNVLLKLGTGATGSVSLANSGDLITKTAHGFPAGMPIKFASVSVSNGITVGTTYYVINPSDDTFQVSTTVGGSAVVISADSTGVLEEVFESIGGMRSRSISIKAEGIEITNEDSDEWKTLLDGAGIRAVAMSGSGVFKDTSCFNRVQTAMMTNALKKYRFYFGTNGSYFEGTFKCTALETSGEYKGEQPYAMSFESSGQVTYTAGT